MGYFARLEPLKSLAQRRRSSLKIRKEYDSHGIEITRWNKGNLVYTIDCDCGRQADRVIGMYETFVCSNCHAMYEKSRGSYTKVTCSIKKENDEYGE